MIKNILQIIGVIIISIFIIGGTILAAVGTTITLKEIETINETVATGIYMSMVYLSMQLGMVLLNY